MNIKYIQENDLMYIYFMNSTPNVQVKTPHHEIGKFVSKQNKKMTVGFEIEHASKNLNYVLTKLDLTRKQKLAICLYFIRETRKQTQKEFSELLSISETTYKCIEKADHNISFDTLDLILEKFHDMQILENVFDLSS